MKSKPFIGTRSEITYRVIYNRVKEKDKMQNAVPLHPTLLHWKQRCV